MYRVIDYQTFQDKVDRELGEWTKYGWGAFIGAVILAIIVDPASYSESRAEGGPAMRVAMWMGIALFVAYRWRKHVLYKRLREIWQNMPLSERNRYSEAKDRSSSISS